MNNYILCSGCHGKYIDDGEHIKCDFEYNRFGDRYKCCVECRNRNKTYREKNNPMANTNKITPTIYDDSNKCHILVYYNMDY